MVSVYYSNLSFAATATRKDQEAPIVLFLSFFHFQVYIFLQLFGFIFETCVE